MKITVVRRCSKSFFYICLGKKASEGFISDPTLDLPKNVIYFLEIQHTNENTAPIYFLF